MRNIEKIERPETLQALAYDRIKDLFISGQLEQDTIYSANQFAEILGVSRTPAREALLQLTTEGLLNSVQGRGFKIRKFSKKEIRDWFELRKMIEVYLIERFIQVMENEDLRAMEDSLQQMINRVNDGDTYVYLEADEVFHTTLVLGHNNKLFERIMIDNRNRVILTCHKALSRPGRIQEIIGEHKDILDAVRQRDTDRAIKAMVHHLDRTEKYLVENL
jgi:DNA-binding GntR family transcriptional regulator